MMKTSIAVTERQNDWIKAQIETGHFGNESEVLREHYLLFEQDIFRLGGDDCPYFSIALEMSVTSNRRKIIAAPGPPIDLRSDGSTPTKSAPFDFSEKPCTSFGRDESGHSNNLTVTGTLEAATTSPSD